MAKATLEQTRQWIDEQITVAAEVLKEVGGLNPNDILTVATYGRQATLEQLVRFMEDTEAD